MFVAHFSVVFIFVFFLTICNISNAKLTIRSTETEFSVWIDFNTKVIEHYNASPAFSISETEVNFIERRGNFVINETVIREPLKLDEFDIFNISDDNGKEAVLIRLRNSIDSTQTVELTLWDWDDLNGVNITCSFRIKILPDDSPYNRILMRMSSAPSEHFYGLGEQFTHLDLKGYNFTVWTREQGVGRNQSDILTQQQEIKEPGSGGDYDYTYWPQSSFLSAQLRYLFGLKSNIYAIFDFQNDHFTEVHCQASDVEGYFVHDDQSLVSLVGKVSQIYGRQKELPEWVYNGAILGVQGGTTQMMDYLREAEENKVAVSALWIQDWSGKIQTDFGTRVFWNWKWNSTWYPMLDEVIQNLRDSKNIRVLGYINPSLNSDGDIYKEGDAFGVFLRQEENTNQTYLQDFGDFFCGTVDLWSDDAIAWYKNVLKENLIRFGFSGWMADFGEYTPLDAVSISRTAPGAQERHNQLPTLWAKLNSEAIKEEEKENEIMFWTRSGSSGAGRYTTMLWGGDQNVDWSYSDGLPSTITAGLSAGMSGMGLFHFDIGCYTTFPDLDLVRSKELLLRSAEYAVFTPVMRTHEGNRPASNHQVYSDIDTWQKFSRLTQMYVMLSNYTRSVVKENANLGIPAMRPLFLHYEYDELSFRHNYQYLYGRDLLVAPVLESNVTEWDVYLPPDEWVFLWQTSDFEEVLIGPQNIIVQASLGYPPVFYRSGSEYTTIFREMRQSFMPSSAFGQSASFLLIISLILSLTVLSFDCY